MRAGGLRNIITIERKVRMGKTAANADITVWKAWRPEVFCEKTARRGKEQFDAAQKRRFAEVVYHFRTRYDEVVGVNETMRIRDEDGQLFDIRSVLPDTQRESDCIIEATLLDGSVEGGALIAEILEEIVAGIVGEAYALQITARGGAVPYSFSAGSGDLPAGLSLDASSGQIAGVPTEAGSFAIEVQVEDANGDIDAMPTFNIEIAA